jgi:hypothetical protein
MLVKRRAAASPLSLCVFIVVFIGGEVRRGYPSRSSSFLVPLPPVATEAHFHGCEGGGAAAAAGFYVSILRRGREEGRERGKWMSEGLILRTWRGTKAAKVTAKGGE